MKVPRLFFYICLFFLYSIPSYAQLDLPWFTGPLLIFTRNITPVGRYAILPFTVVGADVGFYDENGNSQPIPTFLRIEQNLGIQVGLTEWMDVQTFPKVHYKSTEGQGSFQFGDVPVDVDFQLLRDDPNHWAPSILFGIGEIFPTGQYKDLNPDKLFTDIGGDGSFTTRGFLTFAKVYHVQEENYFAPRISVAYYYPTETNVSGLSKYGGDFSTKGTITPGREIWGFISLEYSINRNFVFAFDSLYISRKKDRFRGTSCEEVGRRSGEQFSIAPALEYNFSKNLGIVAGFALTLFGRNSEDYVDGIFSLAYSF